LRYYDKPKTTAEPKPTWYKKKPEFKYVINPSKPVRIAEISLGLAHKVHDARIERGDEYQRQAVSGPHHNQAQKKMNKEYDKADNISGKYIAKRRSGGDAPYHFPGPLREAEQIDELSRLTLKSYISKAAEDKDSLQHGTSDRFKLKNWRRTAGIQLAAYKLEESEQLDELSKKTLKSYINKAATDIGNQRYREGRVVASKKNMRDPIRKGHNRVAGIQQATRQLEEKKQIGSNFIDYIRTSAKEARRRRIHAKQMDKSKDKYDTGERKKLDEHGYVGFYKGTRHEFEAPTSYDAYKQLVAKVKAPKSQAHMAHVHLAELDTPEGRKQVVHTPTMESVANILAEAKKPFHVLKGHPYHHKSDAELHYIIKDAAEAEKNAVDMGDKHGMNKYADQRCDASTVLGYRQHGGKRVPEKLQEDNYLTDRRFQGGYEIPHQDHTEYHAWGHVTHHSDEEAKAARDAKAKEWKQQGHKVTKHRSTNAIYDPDGPYTTTGTVYTARKHHAKG
jgi:hypothetical protein